MLLKFLSKLTISWFSPLLKKGWRNPLEVGDLLPLPQHLVCESAYHAFLRGLSALPTPPSHHGTGTPRGSTSASIGVSDTAGRTESVSGMHTSVDTADRKRAVASENSDENGGVHHHRHVDHAPSPEQHLFNKRALLRLIWLLHGHMLRRALLLIYGYQIFVFFQPILLNALTNQLTEGQPDGPRIWILAGCLFLSPLLGSLCKVQAQLSMIQIQIALRSQLTAAVYRKCLRLSASARASLPSGRVVNLMSADVAKICDFLYPQLTFISVAPLAVVVSLTMLWFQIGWATLVGLAVLLLSSPVSNIAVRATQRYRNDMLKASDSRMKLVGQFLAGVRVIKMYNWEQPQQEAISNCRESELRALRNMIPSKVAMQTLLYVLPQLAGVLSFLVVGLTQPQVLTAGRAFSSLVLFQIMRFPLLTLSTGLVELGAAIISAHRITSFMSAEEQRDYVTRLLQPAGTTPIPPPRSRRGSFCMYDKIGGDGTGSLTSTPVKQDRSFDHRSEGPLFRISGAEVAVGAAATTAAVVEVAGGPSLPSAVIINGGSSTALRMGPLVSTSSHGSRMGLHNLMGVEPGLTIRAAGFKWAAIAAQEHAADHGKGQDARGPTAAGASTAGSVHDGGTAAKSWLRLASRGTGGRSRPFMEVVDSTGESLASGARALHAQITRALTNRRGRDIGADMYVPSSSGNSLIPTTAPPRQAVAVDAICVGGSAASFLEAGVASQQHLGNMQQQDEERVGLLRAADTADVIQDTSSGYRHPAATKEDDMNNVVLCGRGKRPDGDDDVGGGGRIDPAGSATVVVALDSASEGGGGSGSREVLGGGSGGKSAAAVVVHSNNVGVEGIVTPRISSSSSSTTTFSGSDKDATSFTLRQIDLRVCPGELVCVVGRVGSGKSSLLSAALGEMELVEELDPGRGDVVGLGGRVAYVAQQAWIVNATLLDNVTMGRPLDESKWAQCIEACALVPDLELLPAGRDTEIGEKGLNLSGGQKQRLSLARAMYQEADIYLLDDPLSAVDVHVGGHIFNNMIRGALANAAVLLVTNAVQYLPAADRIVVLNAGEVIVQGAYKECLEEPLFRSLLNEFRSEEQQQQQQDQDQTTVTAAGEDISEDGLLPSHRGEGGPGRSEVVGGARSSKGQEVLPPPNYSYPHPLHLPHIHPQQQQQDLRYRLHDQGSRHDHQDQQHRPGSSCPISPTLLAYDSRRMSVELVQRQQALHVQCLPSHIADLDEGNEMMDSLLRMSGGGTSEGRRSDSDSDSGDPCSSLRDGYTAAANGNSRFAPLLAATGGFGVHSLTTAFNNNNNNNNNSSSRGGDAGGNDASDENRPLLSSSSQGRQPRTAAVSSSGTGGVVAESSSSGSHGSNGPGSDCGSGSGGLGGGGRKGSLSNSNVSSTPLRSAAVPAAAAASEGGSVAATTKGRITVTEDRELGQVKWRVYGTYLRAFHLAAAIATLLFWATEQGTRLATNAWLAQWSHSTQQQQQESASNGGFGLGSFAGLYLLLAGVYAFTTFCRSTTNNLGSFRASKILHATTLAALMAAPLSFFEATPVGRILNRLSRDVDEMDYNLAMYQQQLGNCVMRLIATIIFLCVLQPAFVGVVVPLALIYFILQKYFRRSSIELQRIDSVTRSPVYANFAETMSGLDTIRAYRMQERFKERHEGMVDTNATAYYNARVADEWLSLRLDLIGSVIVLSVAALNVGFRSITSVSPALVALALAEAIDLTSFLNYAVKVSALVESRYNAVERLLSYAHLAPEETPEAAQRGPTPYRPPGLPPWPATGKLEFCDVWMSYRPGLAPVLHGVTFKISDGQKVGIAGRTGSGKSSLIVALFRLVEPQRGQMLLDGVDLRTLGLGPARTALSAIPQEPVLFSGSVRSNLDPWDRHSDSELWAALGVVALHEHVRMIGGLSAAVSEGGGNFSVGQRQLVCVARALLKQPRLLVADEATASVDPETDAIIQRAIRTHFKTSTVLAIAHRLNTILDSDVILFMNAGRVSEFGPVQELLANPESSFATMVKDADIYATTET